MRYRGRVLYLASQSPQRAMLLSRAGIPFTVVNSIGDEETVRGLPPIALAIARARIKAEGAVVSKSHAGDVVLGADTVVALGDDVFGKPRDDADGRRILRRLQGTSHQVITGHHLIRLADGVCRSAHAVVEVTMRQVEDREIEAYLATGEHRGRAGAYAIQETADRFVIALNGPWDAVVGLHVASVEVALLELRVAN